MSPYNNAQVEVVRRLWSDGAPPIAKICIHDEPPGQQQMERLGVHFYWVVHTRDGQRHVYYQNGGVGFCMDCAPPTHLP